jgi:transcriptional regulator with XRE-family HTH domain
MRIIMKSVPVLLPKNQRLLVALGERIQLARLRRDWTAENVAYRASISRKTLHNVETGKPTVAIGTYLQVLFVLGLEKDFENLGASDPLGWKLLDLGVLTPKRASKRPKTAE